MARYDYVCGSCGVFEVVRPIDADVSEQACATCGGPAIRRYTPAALTSPGSAQRRLRDAEERSGHEPAIRHGTLPPSNAGARSRARSANPLHARLPRP
jgi:putative FmdB family regulatory protein